MNGIMRICLVFHLLGVFLLVRNSIADGVFKNSIVNQTPNTDSVPDPVEVTVLQDVVLQTVDDRFVSIALDTSVVADGWPCFDFRSLTLHTLARELRPGYLRLGGDAADFMIFTEREKLVQHHLHKKCSTDDNRRNFTNFYMTEADFENINRFAMQADLRLLFDLNLLLRNANNEWNSSNAELLLDYAIHKNYSSNMDFELGNEPNQLSHAYHRNVSAFQLAADYKLLKRLLQKLPASGSSLLVGPAVTQPKQKSLSYLSTFLKASCGTVDAITVHHYYIDGRTATVDDMTSVKVLNSLSKSLTKLRQVINDTECGEVPVWLGETGSCWGGGAPDLSDSFVAGFMWLDKLGLSAQNGIKVVIRQSFFKGHYALVNNSISPNPDYWLTWLFKRLVGRRVLQPVLTNTNKHVRIYAHCTNTERSMYSNGSVTFYALNVGEKNSTVVFNKQLSDLTKHIYCFLPYGPDQLKSRLTSVNGQVLHMLNETALPDVQPIVVEGGQRVSLPAMSYGFIVVPDAQAKACLKQ